MKTTKYRSVKTLSDGITFDSKAESERWNYLRLLERAGEISDLVRQPVYELQPKFSHNGKVVAAMKYVPDFRYIENGKTICEDVKGIVARASRQKHKQFLFKFGESVELRLIKLANKKWVRL